MSKKSQPKPFKEVQSDSFDNNKNQSWVNERLAHEKQLRVYKRIAFWFALIICGALYFTFFLALVMLHFSATAQNEFVVHSHLLGLLISILIIPSAILWGVVRAVFRISEAMGANETIKSISSVHPFS